MYTAFAHSEAPPPNKSWRWYMSHKLNDKTTDPDFPWSYYCIVQIYFYNNIYATAHFCKCYMANIEEYHPYQQEVHRLHSCAVVS